MARTLALQLSERLTAAIHERGCASLIVSGGSTPRDLFGKLSQYELSWQYVTVSLSDERWVSPASEDSNENLVRRLLLKNEASIATFVPLKNHHGSPDTGEQECEAALAEIPSPFDVVILGMGDDGHTASLFPYADDLDAALDLNSGKQCKAIVPKELPEHAPYARMTMTLPRLLESKHIILLFSGDAKWSLYEEAVAGDDVRQYPVRSVLKQSKTPVSVYWAP